MGLMDFINYYYYDLADPRMRDWFFINSVWYPIIVILIYLVTIFKLAPDYMKNRPAYKLNTFIKCFNLFQVIANAYSVKEVVPCYQFRRIFECRPFVYGMTPCDIKIINLAYFGIFLKMSDLIETVVFVLRKKNNQLTILHLYHHISTFLIAAVFPRYLSVEIALLIPIMNCSVHVIMYTYYFLSNFEGPIKKAIIPFKRYLTIIQMTQFVIGITQFSVGIAKGCVPVIPVSILILNFVFNIGLFYNFYKKTYINPKQKKVS